MTNIILPWPGGTPPAPWQKVVGLNGRHIRCTATVAQALGTGGALQHYHNVINFVCGYNPQSGPQYQSWGSLECSKRHNNHPLASSSVSVGTNNPPYQEFELIYMDAAVWESQVRKFPRDALLLSDALLDWASVQRYTSADGRLVKIGASPGVTGGQASVSHSVSLSLGNSPGVLQPSAGSTTGSYDAYRDHAHSSNANSDEKTTMPRRVQTCLYQVIAQTDMALAGVIAFFDGQPSSRWDIMSAWDACFIESAHTEANVTGSSTHPHTGLSGTSGTGQTYGRTPNYVGDGGAAFGYKSHVHLWTADLSEVNHEPEYVNLVAAKLNETLFPGKTVTGAQLIGPLW